MATMQGTYEFMSDDLAETLSSPSPYLHSPIDDLYSFYFTAQWAAAFNDGASGRKQDGTKIKRFRVMVAGSERARATAIASKKRPSLTVRQEYGPFFAQSLALFGPWWERLTALYGEWQGVMNEAEALEGEDKEKHLGRNFLIIGYRGVGEYFKLVHEHRKLLQMAA